MFRRLHHHKRPFSTWPRPRRLALAIAVLAALAVGSQAFALAGGHKLGHGWRMIGRDAAGSRNQPFEHKIGPSSASSLALKWVATTTGDVSATPVVAHGAVYFPDFGGTLWKLDADTGAVIWSHAISEYTGIAGDLSRTSPSLAGKTLVIGDLLAPKMMGIDAKSGELQWITQVNPHPRGIITGSPVLAGDRIYVGVSSREQGAASTRIFRGDFVALDAHTGHIIWQTYGLPDNGGVPNRWAGGAIIAPPAVDVEAGLVYGTYGNLYNSPPDVAACNAASPNGFSESCIPPGAYFKSLVAFDIRTGEPQWSYRVQGHAPWLRACGAQPASVTWCAAESDGEKWDLGGAGPNVFQLGKGKHARDVVGLGEKSGVYLALDAKTGEFLWNTLVGPGGDQGGMEWGTATDGDRIYVAITNQHHISYKLTPSGTTATGGSWAALDPETGQILWQTADPQGAWDLAPPTVANGVVFVGSVAKTGNEMFALDAATGAILWQFAAGSSVNSGPAVVKGSVYWGSGYARAAEGNGNNKFYAFSLDGK